MNEQIKKLIMESINFRLDPDSNAYEAQVCPEDLEYLAELIVRDCIEIVKEDMYSGIGHHSQFSLGSDTALEMAVANIKEKFGVE